MKRNATALILDLSSSMNEDCEPGRTKLEALYDIVAGLTGQFDIICFNDSAWKCSKDEIPTNGKGCTYMSTAIHLCKTEGIKAAIMITDGDASDKSSTLGAATGFGLQIMFVGGGKKPAFLDELAKKCGGYCTKDDITLTKEITAKVQLLLGSGETKKDIQL